MERFLLKGSEKLDMIVGAIGSIALFFAYRIGLGIEARWPYILLAFLSVLILIIFAKDKEVFIKVCAIIITFYSVLSLLKPDLVEKWFAFNFVGKLLAVAFGIFVAFFGFLLGSFWRWIIWGVIYGGYNFIMAPKRRKLPQTKGIRRRDKSIYLYEDYRNKQTQLIYRQGKKKRILDTYLWANEVIHPHYAIEWNGDKCVKVEKYNMKSLKKEEEKIYEIK